MDWEKLFASRILKRGFQYYLDGLVDDFTADEDKLRATVCGTEGYQVEIILRDGEVEDMSCTCPYARGGENCKHMAAALYRWESGEPFDDSEDEEDAEEIAQLLEKADEQAVKQFLASVLREDALLLARFRKAVKLATPEESVRDCIRMADAIRERCEKQGFIDYRDAYDFFSELESVLNNDVQRMIDSGAYWSAFQAANYIFSVICSVEIDDSDGGLSMLGEMIEDIWRTLCGKVNPEEKRRMFQWFLTQLRDKNSDFSEICAAAVLLNNFPEEEFRQPLLTFTEEKLREAQASEEHWAREYAANAWAQRHLALLEREPDADARIEAFCQEYEENQAAREYYIDFCIAHKNYAQALETLDACLGQSHDYPGLIAGYSRKKKEIYLLQGDHKAYLKQLWRLVLEDSAGDLDAYKELKRQYSPEEWEKHRETIFKKLPKRISRAPLYQEEALYDKLLDCVVNSSGLYALKRYEDDLKDRYPAQLLRKYQTELEAMARHASNRSTYQLLVDYLREMQRLEGGGAFVAALVKDWKLRYKRRPAMMQELSRL